MKRLLQILVLLAIVCLPATPSHAACTNKPVVVTDVFNIARNTSVTIFYNTLKSNDFDFDGDALSAVVAGGSQNGVFCGSVPGFGFCYSPNANFSGLDAIPYAVTDGCSTTYGTILIFVK